MISNVANPPECLAIATLSTNELTELLWSARRLFEGTISIEQSVEPEFPAAVYVVVRVVLEEPKPPIEEVINRELAWHREAARIAPQSRGLIRLLVE